MRRLLPALVSLVLLVPCAAPAAESDRDGDDASGKKDKPAAKAGPADSADAAPGPTAVVVVARDLGATDVATTLEQALGARLSADGRLKPIDLLAKLGGEPEKSADKPEVADHFKKGKDAYENLDFPAAAAEFLEGLKLMLDDPAVVQPAAVARALALAGAAYLLNGEAPKATGVFRRAALLSPDWAPDPNEFSPDILAAYADAKKAAATGAKGALTMTSNVSPTLVVVDGTAAGVAPATLKDLPAGRHHVLFKCRGHKPWATFVEVQEGGSASAAAELHPLPEADRFRKSSEIAAAELAQPKPGLGVQELGTVLGARYVVFAVAQSGAGAGAAVEVGAYDLGPRQRRALGVKKNLVPGSPTFDADVQAMARQIGDALFKPTKQIAEEESSSSGGHAWLWPVLGVVGAAVVAGAVTGVVLATQGGNPHASSVVTGIP